jgi:hypothetical protein
MKEPTEFQYFKGWLLFFLVATVGGGIIGIIIGSFLAAFLGAAGMPLPQMTRILQVVGFVIGVPVSYITFRAVVGKYLFPKIEEDEPPPRPNQSLEPTAGRRDAHI